MRFLKFKSELKKILDLNGPPRFITYEEVRGHLGTDAAHIYGGFQAILTDYCEEEGIPYNAYPVGTVKKFATGKGNASKKKMVKAANEKWDKKFTVKNNENEVDARWVGELAFDKMGAT
jgi:Holliday junction resolvasome RuvABC endonuclease subunit